MANSQAIDKILNKQFKKTAFAGYETIDVDSFFDTVIDYLKISDKNVDEYKKQLDKYIKENSDLHTRIDQLLQQLSQKQALIDRYESEGYGNVLMNKRITELGEEVKKLKKGDNNGK